jgi:inosine triphosphate pyrophosphatase
VLFITGNEHKYQEALAILPGLERLALDLDELQSLDVEEIVRAKLDQAYQRVGEPCVVEDTSLEVERLKGLPGPLVKHFLARLGAQGLGELCAGSRATAVCCVGYHDGSEVLLFRGELQGRIILASGKSGFGWDPIFVPDGEEVSFADLGARKLEISHRTRAFRALLEHLKQDC